MRLTLSMEITFQGSSPMCCQPGISSSTSKPISSQASRSGGTGIVRGSDNIVFSLCVGFARRGAAPGQALPTHPRKCLMTIQPAQLDDFAVELEPWSVNWASRKPRVRETSQPAVPRRRRTCTRVQIGMLQIPISFDGTKTIQMDTVRDWMADGGRRNTLHAFGEHLIAVDGGQPQSEGCFFASRWLHQALNEDSPHAGGAQPARLSLGENILINVGGTTRRELR